MVIQTSLHCNQVLENMMGNQFHVQGKLHNFGRGQGSEIQNEIKLAFKVAPIIHGISLSDILDVNEITQTNDTQRQRSVPD